MPRKNKEYLANASLIKRLLAFLLDLLILDFFVLEPFSGLFRSSMPSGSIKDIYHLLMQDNVFVSTIYVSSVFMALIMLFYFAMMEWKLGQTIGKMLFGIFVVPYESASNEKNIKLWQSFLRSIYLLPIFPFILLLFIDPIYLFFNPENQRLSERLSSTRTIEKISVGLNFSSAMPTKN